MCNSQLLQQVGRGKAVAVMPQGKSSASEVLRITKVRHLANSFIGLVDGGVYSAASAQGIGSSSGTYIVLATDEHRATLHERQMIARAAKHMKSAVC